MIRMDSARETAGKTRDTLAPYATTAKETALRYTDEARHRLGPTMEAIGPKVSAAGNQARTGAVHAAQTAHVQYTKHVAPQLEHAFFTLPPGAQQNTLKALHRMEEAALAAKLSAVKAADQARTTVVPKVTEAVGGARSAITPVAQEAQLRSAAALTALQGHVTSAEISELAAKNIKREQRSSWATGLAVAGTIAIGGGVVAWQWWRRQSNPEWLVEPPTAEDAAAGPGTRAPGGDTVLNGSAPTDQQTVQSDGPNGRHTPPSDSAGSDSTPTPNPTPGKPAPDDRPKPHDPRKPH